MPPKKAAEAGAIAPPPATTQAEPQLAGDAPRPEAELEAAGPGDGGKREAAFAAQMDTLEALAEQHGLDLESLVGDLRDAMLELFKQKPKPWGQLVAGEQRDVAAALEFAAKVLVKKAVIQIAAAERPCVRGKLKKFSHDGAKVTAMLEVPLTDDETILSLNHASGKEVLIITADPDPFMGQRRDPDIREDQEALEFAAGNDRDLAEAAERSLEAGGEEEHEQEEDPE